MDIHYVRERCLERFKLIQQHCGQNTAGEYAKQMPKLCNCDENGSWTHQIEFGDKWIVNGSMVKVDAGQNTFVIRLVEYERQREWWILWWLCRHHWCVDMTVIDFGWCGWNCVASGWISWFDVTMTKIFARLGKWCGEYDARHKPCRRNFAQINKKCCSPLPFSPIAQNITDDIVRRRRRFLRIHVVARTRYTYTAECEMLRNKINRFHLMRTTSNSFWLNSIRVQCLRHDDLICHGILFAHCTR